MKIAIIIGLLLYATHTQAKFYQIVYISPTGSDITKTDGFYRFENADLIIQYSFWAANGIMGFQIYNKTDHPIYIDWKKSALINNGRQTPYYTNKTVSNYNAFGTGYEDSWINIFNGVSSYSTNSVVGQETVVKQERTTFILPHSYVYKAFYDLIGNIAFTINEDKQQEVKVNGCPVYVSIPGNPIQFRNYITYSSSEDFTSESHVDNEFFVKKVITMRSQYFKTVHNDGSYEIEWESPTKFYIPNIKAGYLFE